MYKVVSCPQCGKQLCRAETQSKIEITCPRCKYSQEIFIDKDEGIHALPLETKSEYYMQRQRQRA